MSTEFRIGLEGSRNSSKVLKPPGGGSSDIFGTSAGTVAGTPKSEASQGTKHRIFGYAQESESPASSRKRQAKRNPITGEGCDEENKDDEKEKGAGDASISEKASEQPTVETPRVVPTVVTSIRVRNPPGGKSSGIF